MSPPQQNPLSLALKLRTNTCVRGELVFFDAVLVNQGTIPIAGLLAPEPENEALWIRAVTPEEKRRHESQGRLSPTQPGKPGFQNSYLKRDGVPVHAPDSQKRTNMEPGTDIKVQGDVLKWVGELDQGTYEITASYKSPRRTIRSEPVTLTILPANPTALEAARPALQTADAPLTSAWVHGGDKGSVIFYSQPSVRKPENLWLGARVAEVKSATDVCAANLPTCQAKKGHLFWAEKDQLFMGLIDIPSGRAVAGLTKATPLDRILKSPLSLHDGAAFLVMADGGGKKAALFKVEATGAATSWPLDLGGASPIGAYSCCWEGTERLQLFWAAANGKRLQRGVVSLENPPTDPRTEVVHTFPDPIVWIEGYLDYGSALMGIPAFEHEEDPSAEPVEPQFPDPKPMAWVVMKKDKAIVVARAHATYKVVKTMRTFMMPEGKDLQVHSAVRSGKRNLGVLLTAPGGELWYADTEDGALATVEERTQKQISIVQRPALFSASDLGTLPWVFLRYMEPTRGRIGSVKLAPV